MITLKNTRGFTLIELLVVIAIIGILASVVLASLNQARSKGQDANVQASINNARAQAELYYDNNNRVYTGLCGSAGILQIQTGVNSAGGTFSCSASTPQAYRISSVMVSTTTRWYCVDSTGRAGLVSSAPSGDVCP